MSLVALAIGLVLVVEGLALALAPRRMEDALRALAALSQDQRRAIGLAALAIGVLLVWLSRTA
ncbi:DUF2065 domain-containing protein [Tabrizicola piscis]|jgi:uncharacterized protein|uniref:DUF2065 domain-containing protein n=1 Tax=Tabrizicola piscis TaxID=2494374 RepID=A0A3S8U9M6_9RHOB|nr:DUF2065 domain-containing protein [Tabrizicola piscis]AZL60442.1 DUF2065 domain-containing protein [Tabrizicola piscis]